jgi:hypothetical protein
MDSIYEEEKCLYVALVETDPKKLESWYYFIQYTDNETVLENLESQLDVIRFDNTGPKYSLDINNRLSEGTVNEMIKVDVNTQMYHKKVGGILRKVNIHMLRSDDNDTRKAKAVKALSKGKILSCVKTAEEVFSLLDEDEEP